MMVGRCARPLAPLALLALLGCATAAGGAGDALAPDGGGGAADLHPLAAGAASEACPAPDVCDPGDRSWEDLILEQKAFFQSHPVCTPVPDELQCQLRTAQEGRAWPADVSARIAAVSAATGGFAPTQVAALECLAFGSRGEIHWTLTGAGPDTRAPGVVTLDAPLESPAADPEALADAFEARWAGLVGAAWHVTDRYEFERTAEPWDAPGVLVRYEVRSYAGIPTAPGWGMALDVHVAPRSAPGPDGGGSVVCPDWRVVRVSGDLSRQIEALETDPRRLVPAESALAAALADCGADCAWPDDPARVGAVLPAPALRIAADRVLWQVRVGIPNPCDGDERWAGTWWVDAVTGGVVSGGPDCCVDCI